MIAIAERITIFPDAFIFLTSSSVSCTEQNQRFLLMLPSCFHPIWLEFECKRLLIWDQITLQIIDSNGKIVLYDQIWYWLVSFIWLIKFRKIIPGLHAGSLTFSPLCMMPLHCTASLSQQYLGSKIRYFLYKTSVFRRIHMKKLCFSAGTFHIQRL